MSMKKSGMMKKERGRHPLPLPHLGNERGMLLVIVMVIMLVVSSLAASSLINSFLEKSLSENQNYASIALQAADGGLADGMTWIRENRTSLPSSPPWTDAGGNVWVKTLTGSLSSGGKYQTTMRFKREWFDYDGDTTCVGPGESSGYSDGDGQDPVTDCNDLGGGAGYGGEYVLYNSCVTTLDQCWGFNDSLYNAAGEGYPIIEILSTGYYSSGALNLDKYASVREIAMDVARNKIDIQVEGAITARGDITQSGSGYADGHNFNMAGDALSPTCADLPSVTVDQGLTPPPCAADNDPANPPTGNPKGLYGGTECTKEYDPTAPGKRPLETTPWGLMGIDESDFNGIFTATTTAVDFTGTEANPTYVWQQGDMHITGGSGFGILVVHNVNFHPDVYEVSDPTSGTYDTGHGLYATEADSSHVDYDPSYAPATLFMNGIADFTGVIIADNILRVNGTAETIGAMISLGGINVSGDVTGNWTAKYSCDAVEAALGGFGYGTKLNWHRIR
jgi:type II secretory pathway pseudopilin PulG